MTSVIDGHKANLKKLGWNDLEDCLKNPANLYIGRSVVYVKGANSSKWRNPFSVKKFGREKCLELYEEHVRKNLYSELEELKGKTLVCWCTNLPCHGHVLMKLLKEKTLE